jgi:hypothetical protein
MFNLFFGKKINKGLKKKRFGQSLLFSGVRPMYPIFLKREKERKDCPADKFSQIAQIGQFF